MKFAAFDVDGTIIRTSLFTQIVEELLAQGALNQNLRTSIDDKFEAYRTRQHPTAFSEYSEHVVKSLFDNLAGLPVATYQAAVDQVIARNRGHHYVYTKNLIKKLKDDGFFLIALSGSEQYALDRFLEPYGFDYTAGDVYLTKEEHRQNFFIGEWESVFSEKGAALKKVIAEKQLDYTDSLAIGDSAMDAKMLELVERPIAFNPEAKLEKLAREAGWPIVIERKNVIYRLEQNKDGQYVLA